MMHVNGWDSSLGFVTPVGSVAPSSTPQPLGFKPPPVNMRNMTGIYASNEKIEEPHQMRPLHLLQPLTKARGTPRAPVSLPEIRRDKPSSRPVENVRRGFSGLPLKKRMSSAYEQSQDRKQRETQAVQTWWIPEYRQTARNFTLTTSSSLIPRLENLRSPLEDDRIHSQKILSAHLVANQINKRHRSDALAECYRTVLKGSTDALAIILPNREQETPKRPSNKGTARLQNPQAAQIMAFFPEVKQTRTRKAQSASSLLQRSMSRASTNSEGAPGSRKCGNNASNPGNSHSALRTVALVLPPGVESTLADSVVHSTVSASTSQARSGATIPPRNTASGRPSGERAESPDSPEEEKEDNRVQITLPSDEEGNGDSGPPASVLEGTKDAESAAEAVAKHLEACGTAAEVCSTASIEIKVDQTDASSMEGRSSGILIALEDDSGSQKPIEIDEADDDVKPEPDVKDEGEEVIEETENDANKRRVSITERILKTKNHEQILASIAESTETRKRMLEDLLSEHQQLVHELSSMEGSSIPGSDKENEEVNNKEISEKTSPIN